MRLDRQADSICLTFLTDNQLSSFVSGIVHLSATLSAAFKSKNIVSNASKFTRICSVRQNCKPVILFFDFSLELDNGIQSGEFAVESLLERTQQDTALVRHGHGRAAED